MKKGTKSLVSKDQQIGVQKFVNMRDRKTAPFSIQKGRQIAILPQRAENTFQKGSSNPVSYAKTQCVIYGLTKIAFTNWCETLNYLVLKPVHSPEKTIDAVTFPLRHL